MSAYLLAGGGTAGHVTPLLATADRLRERVPEARILVLGTAEGLEARLVPQRGYELLTVERLPFPRRPGRAALSFPSRLRAAVDRTRGFLREHEISAVVGFGGYASAPAYLAARRERLPLVVHEANARPGIANRLGAALTPFVGVTFEATRLRRGRLTGLPLRPEIQHLDRASARREAIEYFGLDAGRPTLLVTGGSTGALHLNSQLTLGAAAILGSGWQIIHLTGGRVEVPDPKLDGYRMLDYCDRMELAIAVADLAVSRAGAATVCEFAALGVPAVFVPYEVGNGEQRINARDAVDAGGAILIGNAELTQQWISSSLTRLLRDPAAVAEMAARMASVGSLDGADRLVDLILEAGGEHAPAAARQYPGDDDQA